MEVVSFDEEQGEGQKKEMIDLTAFKHMFGHCRIDNHCYGYQGIGHWS